MKTTMTGSPPRLLAFDLEVTGHHASYLQYLVRAWGTRPRAGTLHFAVSDEFERRHGGLAAEARAAGVTLHVVRPRRLPAIAADRLPVPGKLVVQALEEWLALTTAAREVGAAHVVSMYMDRLLQVPLAMGLRAPCPLSGIYFRPTFHYAALTGRAESRKDAFRAARQRAVVRAALRNPCLNTLFSLDPYAAESLNQSGGHGLKCKALPDPVPHEPVAPSRVAALRTRLGLEPRQKVALIFGMISSRKGVDRALQALRSLDPTDAARLALVLVGTTEPSYRHTLEADLAATRRVCQATIHREDEFVPEADTALWFELADLVLIPYDRHVGSSGILIRAAAARKPVIADAFGLVGALVSRRRLGAAIETSSARSFADTLTAWLADPGVFGVQPTDQARFAVDNRAEAFAERLFALVT